MAKTNPTELGAASSASHSKLPRLPNNATIKKRPLMHPPIASSLADASIPKVIYVSSKTPFISTVKRVQKYLLDGDKRTIGALDLRGPGNHREKLARLGKGRSSRVGNGDEQEGDGRNGNAKENADATAKGREEVTVKGTGRAIEKALQVGMWFQTHDGYAVQLRTGTVGAIDDIIVPEERSGPGTGEEEAHEEEKEHCEEGEGERERKMKRKRNNEEEEQIAELKLDTQFQETRLRRTSMLEVVISLA